MATIKLATRIYGYERTATAQAYFQKLCMLGRVLSVKAEEKVRIVEPPKGTKAEDKIFYAAENEVYVDFSMVISINDFEVEVLEKFEIPQETIKSE